MEYGNFESDKASQKSQNGLKSKIEEGEFPLRTHDKVKSFEREC